MARSITERRWFVVLVPGALLALSATAAVSAQEATAPGTAAAVSAPRTDGYISPEAQAVLDRMQASFKNMRRFQLTADITRDELLAFGYKLQNNESAKMWVDAPKRFRLEVNGDIKNRIYVYDGSQLTMLAPDLSNARLTSCLSFRVRPSAGSASRADAPPEMRQSSRSSALSPRTRS